MASISSTGARVNVEGRGVTFTQRRASCYQPRHGVSLTRSLMDLCVCGPGRAGLMHKTAHAKAQAALRSPSYETHPRFDTPE